MIFKEKLNLDLRKSFSMRNFMQIHFFKLVFNCSYESIDFQNNNSKDLNV